jgi:hypothetical protein
MYEWDADAQAELEDIIGRNEKELKKRAEAMLRGERVESRFKTTQPRKKKRGKKAPCGVTEPHPMPIVGICPLCGEAVTGEVQPSCEQSNTGRLFYKECSVCPYYSELFKKRIRSKDYLREEGGG